MKRAFLVANREYLENVRTKGFWIGILMMPVILVLFAVIPVLVESTREVKQYAVIDESGFLAQAVTSRVNASDFAMFLRVARDMDSPRLPGPLIEFNEGLSELEDSELRDVADAVLNGAAYDEFPVAVRDNILRRGGDMATWWNGLAGDGRAEYSARISSNFFERVSAEGETPESLRERVATGELFAYFVIGPDPVTDSTGSRYVSSNLTDRDLLNWYGGFVSREVRERRVTEAEVEPDTADWINEPIEFEGIRLSETGAEEEVEGEDVARQWAPVVFVYLLWISILINTQMLLTNTIEEKSNKLIEVLLSSISPIELMAGKIVGIAATGLTIILCWGIMAGSFFLLLPMLAGISPPFDPGSILGDLRFTGSFVVYFVLGYLLYAAILVGLGSVCSNLKEAQNLMIPVQMIQMIPIFVMIPIGRDPNGWLAQVLSYVPPLTPFIMMNRAAAPPSDFEYVTTTLLLVISIVAMLWLAARIFRVGILMTGQAPSPREIWRLLRAPD